MYVINDDFLIIDVLNQTVDKIIKKMSSSFLYRKNIN